MNIDVGAEVELLNYPLSNQFGRVKTIYKPIITPGARETLLLTILLYNGSEVFVTIEKEHFAQRVRIVEKA